MNCSLWSAVIKIWKGAGKNSQGAVSHKGALWQSWPRQPPAGSATLMPQGNGSVFGFAWRNCPQARRGEELAHRKHLFQPPIYCKMGEKADPKTWHLHANLILPKLVPTSNPGRAGNLQLGSSPFAQYFGLSLNLNMDHTELLMLLIESAGKCSRMPLAAPSSSSGTARQLLEL